MRRSATLLAGRALVRGRAAVDPESGMPEPPPARRTAAAGRSAGPTAGQRTRPSRVGDRPRRPTGTRRRRGRRRWAGAGTRSKVARIEPEPPPQARGGSTRDLSDWERWLEFCARIDGFPRHLSIHSGGMLVTAAPLIDIAPIERATMPDRVVVQFDKRDVEELKLIKLDLLGLGHARRDRRDDPADRARLRGLRRPRLAARRRSPRSSQMLQAADTVGVFQVESRAQMQTLPKSRPGNLDDLVVEVAIIRPGPIQGNAVHPYLRRKQGLEPVELPPPQPRAGPPGHAGRDPLPGAGHADRDRGRRLLAGRVATGSGGRWAPGARPARWRSSTRGSSRARCASRG